jgi:chitinase
MRALLLVPALVLLFSAAACGDSGDSGSAGKGGSSGSGASGQGGAATGGSGGTAGATSGGGTAGVTSGGGTAGVSSGGASGGGTGGGAAGTVGNAPVATINHPGDGETRPVNQPIPFGGTGTDVEDGTLTGASLVWTSSLEGQIGTGENFSGTLTQQGAHQITLTVTDSDGNDGTASITLNIQ